jgi:hypothetical protein
MMRLFKLRSFLLVAAIIPWLWQAAPAAGAAAPENLRQKVVADSQGKTTQFLDDQGRVVRTLRFNDFGYPKKIETTYEYDKKGQRLKGTAKDAEGITQEEYGKGGKLEQTLRKIKTGPELGRETKTVCVYDKEGRLVSREISNGLMTRMETLDANGRVVKAVQDDKFGVEWGRHKEFTDYRYNAQGVLESQVETSQLQTVTHLYNPQGLAAESRYERKTGLGALRKSVETTTFNPETGKPVSRVETSDYGRIETTQFDPELLLPVKQSAKYKFGLGSTRSTEIQYTWDKRYGLPQTRVDTNQYGVVQTFYDTSEGGTYGITVGSQARYNYGLGSTRKTRTVIQSDKRNGLTRATKATNDYETRWTVYDAYHDGLFGVAEKARVERNFGLGGTRKRMIQLEVNTWNGLYKRTKEY